MKAMIFAAGMGTRLKPLTDTMPKAMVPIAGRPLLEHVILKLKAAGFTHIMVNVHHFPDQIIDFLKRNDNFGLHIEISDERDLLLDTGGALRKARHFFQDAPFLAHNVDILSNIDLAHLMQTHTKSQVASHKSQVQSLETHPNGSLRPSTFDFQPSVATLVVSERDTQRYLLFDQEHTLRGWTNIKTNEVKPAGITPAHFTPLAFSGIQVLSPEIFDCMDHFPAKFSLIELYLHAMQSHTIRAYVPSNLRMMDVGKIDTIDQALDFV